MIEIIPDSHPIVVHFTLGLLGISVVLFLAATLIRQPLLRNQLGIVARWNLWLGVFIIVGTVIVGLHAFNAVAHGSGAQHLAMLEKETGRPQTAGRQRIAEHKQTEHRRTAVVDPVAGNGRAEDHGGAAGHPHVGMTGEPKEHTPSKKQRASGHQREPMAEHASQPETNDGPMKHDDHGQSAVEVEGGEHGRSGEHAKPPEHGKAMDHASMHGFYGSYPLSRESSGTAWVPDSFSMEGIHGMHGKWMTMVHGYANLIYDHQGGSRGDEKIFSESMLMAMAMRQLGPGTFGLRSMFSLDPLMGKKGYPLLLQTGETADGRTPLIDRQHPHDLLMELAASYSLPLDESSSIFGYLGYPGEPALGPPTFMHRFSGMDNPEAPLGHHWLDSTHISFGVATLGYVWRNWKIEVSAFNGHEPDEERWNFDSPRLNSFSGRISYNPTSHWSMQLSHGRLDSPEQLEPGIDQRRTTASAIYNLPFGNNNWQTTLAWGRNDKNPGGTTDAVLLETAVKLHDKHTVFGRVEYAEKNELFETDHPLFGETFTVGKLSLGYIYDIPLAEHITLGLGGLGSIYALPERFDPYYGGNPVSFMIFARLKLK